LTITLPIEISAIVTLQYDKVIFILEPSDQAKAAIGKRVTVLAYRTFDELRHVHEPSDPGPLAFVEGREDALNARCGSLLAKP
jgi:hypothetical protein